MNAQKPKICVVGSAMTDQITRAPRLPVAGETLMATSYTLGFGGKGSNQAVMAARLGADVSMVAKLGRDLFGQNTLENYVSHGINTEFVFWDEQLPSGVAPIWVDETTGQNQILVVPGANAALTPAEVRRAASQIAQSAVLVCQNEIPMACNREALSIARAKGVLTIFNPAPAVPTPADIWALADIATPNEVEAALLTGVSTQDDEGALQAARVLCERGAKTVLLTLGARGALVVEESGHHWIAAKPVQAVDTTGAGDAFMGSLAFFLATGQSLREAATRACRVASLSVSKTGTQTSFPTAAEVAAAEVAATEVAATEN